jgi:hypothetical protein
MNTLLGFSTATHGNAFSASLSIDTLRERVPAVFAPSAHERMSATELPNAQTVEQIEALLPWNRELQP